MRRRGGRCLPASPRPGSRPLACALLPQDQPLRDGLLCVAVKPSQCLVLGVLREDAVCSLGTKTAIRVILRPQHQTATHPEHCLTWYKKLSLWKASRSFTGPAMSVCSSSRMSCPRRAQGLLGTVVQEPQSRHHPCQRPDYPTDLVCASFPGRRP